MFKKDTANKISINRVQKDTVLFIMVSFLYVTKRKMYELHRFNIFVTFAGYDGASFYRIGDILKTVRSAKIIFL